jgi:hypothetical protein
VEKATAERQLTLSDEQIKLWEQFSPEYHERHFEAPNTGALVAADIFFVGVLKGVGKVYLIRKSCLTHDRFGGPCQPVTLFVQPAVTYLRIPNLSAAFKFWQVKVLNRVVANHSNITLRYTIVHGRKDIWGLN